MADPSISSCIVKHLILFYITVYTRSHILSGQARIAIWYLVYKLYLQFMNKGLCYR